MPSRAHIALSLGTAPAVGGVERNIIQLVQGLGDTFRFTIFAPTPTAEFKAGLKAANVDVDYLEIGPFSKPSFRATKAFRSALKENGVDVLHSHDPKSRIYGHLASKSLGLPSVHTVHMSPLFYEGSATKMGLYRTIDGIYNKRLTTAMLFVSNNVRQEYISRGLVGENASYWVPNGIDTRPFREAESRHDGRQVNGDWTDGVARGITVGRLHYQKGFDVMLDAIKLATQRNTTPFQMLVVGDGELRESLETQATQLGIADVVRFSGWKTEPEVTTLLTQADFFVLPSRFECFPYSLLEAAAAGLPTVATDVGGNNEIVANGKSGIVVDSEDTAALAEAMVTVLESNCTEYRTGALAQANMFSIENMLARTNEVYGSILGK